MYNASIFPSLKDIFVPTNLEKYYGLSYSSK